MISWIQSSFHRHFKWLFFLLLGVVIISFVFITNASSGLGQPGERKLPPRPFLGLDLSKAEDQRQLGTDARLSIDLRFKPQGDISEAQLSQYALQRHASLHLAGQLGLPAPTDEALVAHIRTLRAFANPDGQFDHKLYSDFIDSLKTNPRLTEGEVSRVISEDAIVVAYEKLLAGPGYVLPSDVVDMLAQRDTTWTLAIATVDASGFAPRIDTADTALQTWFDANTRAYEIASRVSVAALVVPATKFADGIILADSAIRAAYDANPSRYPAPTPVPPAALVLKLDPETGKDLNADDAYLAVRPLVEADLRKQRSEQAALAAASDLAVQLLEQNVEPDALAPFVAKHPGVTLLEVGPIGPGAIPASLGGNTVSAQIIPETLRLTSERPYSNPVPTPDGAALLVWRETIPARTPPFAEVRDQVLSDYQAAEKRRLFNEAGRTLQTATATAVAAGRPFADSVTTAATAAGLKAAVKTPTPFSMSGQFPQDMDYTALQALQTLSKGKVSDFLPSGETSGVLVYAIDQQRPAADPASPAYIEMRDRLAQNLGRSNAQSLISSLVEAELTKTAPGTSTE